MNLYAKLIERETAGRPVTVGLIGAGTVARLPLTNVVTGKQMCINAPNGAPDCVAASEALCRAKGYQRGASLDITSAYRCPAAFWAERREPNDKDCVNEAFVSKAVCQ